jgi:hypothetical protein
MTTSYTGLSITITTEHIQRGQRQNCGLCPIALAILEILPLADVDVDVGVIRIDDLCYAVPESVNSFIYRFDRSKNLQELSGFTFTLGAAWLAEHS